MPHGPLGGAHLAENQLVVGRIGRAHGVRGDVLVEVRTDDPERRFAPGAELGTAPSVRGGSLTVRSARPQSGRLVVAFEAVDDRTDAESLRGVLLVVDQATAGVLDDPDEFWDHDLVGLTARTDDGRPLGPVVEVLHPPGSSLLVVRREDGSELLVPFVAAIVPTVDVAGGYLEIDPPPGLVDPVEDDERAAD